MNQKLCREYKLPSVGPSRRGGEPIMMAPPEDTKTPAVQFVRRTPTQKKCIEFHRASFSPSNRKRTNISRELTQCFRTLASAFATALRC